MSIFARLDLNRRRQSGFSRLYIMERLTQYYGGFNGLVDQDTGYTDQSIVGNDVRLLVGEKVGYRRGRFGSLGDGFVRGEGR